MYDLTNFVDDRNWRLDALPLGQITEQFCTYAESCEALELHETGDFLRIAARLILAKSEMLLPRPVVEAEPDDAGLELAAVFDSSQPIREAALQLALRQGEESFSPPTRPLPERPIEPRSPLALRRAWDDLLARRGPGVVQVTAPAFVRLEVALSSLIRRLKSGTKVSLARVLRGASRQDAVVHFLAVLELLRRRQASVHQRSLFEDISIEWVDNGAEARSRAG